MARTPQTRSGKRTIGPKTRFAPELLALEHRDTPATIYVDLGFTGTIGGNPDQDFVGVGQQAGTTVAKTDLTLFDLGSAGTVTGNGNFATTDVTAAFVAARDNAGADTIILGSGNFPLDNTQGQSLTGGFGGFNDNTFFFNLDPLTIAGSGNSTTGTESVIDPTADVFDPADPATAQDPVFAIRLGASFIGVDFTLDGSGQQIGTGVGVSGQSAAQFQRTTFRGLSADGGAFGDAIVANQNATAFFDVRESVLAGNAKSGVVLVDSDGQVLNNTITGNGTADKIAYGVEAQGASTVYISGNAITAFTGQNAPSFSAGVGGATGARLLVFGNTITGNAQGVALGNPGQQTDASTAVVNFNDLSGNVLSALDAVNVAQGAGVRTGVDAGIDGRNNFFGAASGPSRVASTGSTGDAQLNPLGTGGIAQGNVQIGAFRTVNVPRTLVSPGVAVNDPNLVSLARANFLGAGVQLKIYVNSPIAPFTGTAGAAPDQDFNAGSVGQPSVAKGDLTFVAAGTPFGPGGITAAGSYAVPDLTTAFNLARDNPGADFIFLAASDVVYPLDNAFNGQSTQVGGFNDNSYWFNNSPLTITGSGKAKSIISPQASTYDANDPNTDTSDPLMAVRVGGSFTGTDFTLDGSGVQIGVGLGASGGSSVTLSGSSIEDFSAIPGGAGLAPFGFGLSVNNAAPGLGGATLITNSSFTGNARAGVSLLNADGQIYGSTFTGRGAGAAVDYGVQALGDSDLYVTGSTFSNYKGLDGVLGSAGISGAQDATAPGAGATILAVGNALTGNAFGLILGAVGQTTDPSKAVVQFNDLSNNTVALDAVASLRGPAVTTGVDAGIDGRFNFFGAGGPNRQASTGSNGDGQINPGGTGSQANGNVAIGGFRTSPIQPAVPAQQGGPGVTLGTAGSTQTLADATAKAIVPFLSNPAAAGSTLIIYINGAESAFADADANGKADQVFNGAGTLATQPANSIQFVPAGTLYSSLGFAAGSTNKIAVPDLATALALARDNPGADVINLAASTSAFDFNNSQGGSLSGNTYTFNGPDNDLTIVGSGQGNTLIRPTAGTYTGLGSGTEFDPVFLVQNGADFSGTGFTLDGGLGKFGSGILATPTLPGGGTGTATNVSLTGVGIRNFVAEDGSATNGATSGFGVVVLNPAGTTSQVTITDSKFSGNGRGGVQTTNANLQVLGSTFTGRGAGNLLDYGIQAIGTGKVYVTGSRFTGFLGKAGVDGTESAGLVVSQDVDAANAPVAGGPSLLAVGNSITGNRIGVSVVNLSATGTATAELRFNDLSGNNRPVEVIGAGGGSVAALNDYFGGAVNATANGGTVTVTDERPVTAPTVSVASTYGTAASAALNAAGTAAAQAYVADPAVASAITVNNPAATTSSNVTFTLTFDEPLINPTAAQTIARENILRSLLTGTYTPLATAANPSPTSVTLAVGAVTIAADGRTATVALTVPAGATQGVVRLTVKGSNVALSTGNLVTSPTGTAPGGDPNFTNSGSLLFGAANTGPTLTVTTPANGATATVGLNGGTTNVALTAAATGGRTIVSTVVSGTTGPITVGANTGTATNPVFTVTGTGTTPGVGSVTITTTDSDGLTTSRTIPVQVGQTSGVTLTVNPNTLTFPFGSTTPQTSTGTVTFPNGSGTVTFTNPRPDLVTVVQGGTATAPTFTVTPIAGQTGTAVITVTARDVGGAVSTSAIGVQVGNTAASNISGLPTTTQTIPFNTTNTYPFTVSGTEPLTVAVSSSNPLIKATVSGTGANRTISVIGDPTLTNGGPATITVTLTDGNNQTTTQSFTVQVAAQRQRRFAAGTGVGVPASVQVYDSNGVKLFGFTPFELSFTGGVSVATGDINADGIDDIVVGAATGGGPRVKVFDGATGVVLADFFAFESTTRTGVNVAVAKASDTGTDARGYFREQIIVGSGDGGGPRVSVFDLKTVGSAPVLLSNFFAFESEFRNGVTVGAVDLTGDGLAEVITGSGLGGGPRVRAFTATTGAATSYDFFAFDTGFRGGVNVAGYLDANNKPVIVAAAGQGGGSLVRVYSAASPLTGSPSATSQFQAYTDSAAAGVRLTTGKFGTATVDSIITGGGLGSGPLVKVFSGTSPSGTPTFADFAFSDRSDDGKFFRGGIYVG